MPALSINQVDNAVIEPSHDKRLREDDRWLREVIGVGEYREPLPGERIVYRLTPEDAATSNDDWLLSRLGITVEAGDEIEGYFLDANEDGTAKLLLCQGRLGPGRLIISAAPLDRERAAKLYDPYPPPALRPRPGHWAFV